MTHLSTLARSTVIAGLMIATTVVGAHAGTITTSGWFSSPNSGPSPTKTGTDWNTGAQTITVDSFDTTLGTLTSAVISFTGYVDSSGSLTNTGGSTSTINSYVANTKLKLLNLGFSGVYVDGPNNPTGNGTGAAGNTLITVTPNLINLSFTTLAPSASQTFNVSDSTATGGLTITGAGLSAYETNGIGSLIFPLFTTTQTVYDGTGGTLVLTQETGAAAFLQITYNYTTNEVPVPEPASLAILGLSLTGLGLLRRRKI